MTTFENTMRLSGIDVAIPPLALGTMYWGTDVAVPVAHDLLDMALERGATFVDTANNYAFWREGATGDESEQCLGAWVAARGSAARERVTLATKVGARPARPGGDLSDAMGLRPASVAEQVRASLARLRTDHVDVVYAHIDDDTVPMPEILGGLQQLVTDGLTRAIAASNLTAPRLAEATGAAGDGPRYAALQNRFTYLTPAPTADLSPHVLLDEETVVVARDAGVSLLGYSPLLSGAYTRTDRELPEGFRHSGTQSALSALHDAADAHGLDAGQMVLAWMTQRTDPVIPVVGVSSREQLIRAAQAVSTHIEPRVLDALDHTRNGTHR